MAYKTRVRDSAPIPNANDNNFGYRPTNGKIVGKNVIWNDKAVKKKPNVPTQKATRTDIKLNSAQPDYNRFNASHSPQFNTNPSQANSANSSHHFTSHTGAQPGFSVTEPKHDGGIIMSVFLWLISLSSLIGAVLLGANGRWQFLASIMLIWTGLWIGYLGHDRQKPRVGDCGVFTAILGLFAVLMTLGTQFSLPILSFVNCLAILAVFSLICALIVSSRIALIMSACFTVLSAYFHFTGTPASVLSIIAFPAIFTTQTLLAARLQSRLALIGVLTAGLYAGLGFIVALVMSGQISTLNGVTLAALIGTLQHQFGKAGQGENVFGAGLHVLAGWSLTIACGLVMQLYWYDPNIAFWQYLPLVAVDSFSVNALFFFCLAGVFMTGLVRWKQGQLGGVGVVIIPIICAGVALISLYAREINSYLDVVKPVVSTTPILPEYIGLAIASAILSSAIIMIVNSMRWRKSSMVGLGGLAIALQIYIIGRVDVLTSEAIIVFTIMILTAFSVAAVLMAKTLEDMPLIYDQVSHS